MTTTTLSKTAGTVILAHQAVTHPGTVKGAAQDVSTKLAAKVILFHALVEAVANTNPGFFLIQGCALGSGSEDWFTIAKVTARITTPDSEALTGTEAIGSDILDVASSAGFAAGDILYIQDTGVAADSEWNLCQEVTGTTIVLLDGLTNAKDSADVIWNDAEVIEVDVDCTALTRLRVVFMHEGAVAANAHVKAMMITTNNMNTV